MLSPALYRFISEDGVYKVKAEFGRSVIKERKNVFALLDKSFISNMKETRLLPEWQLCGES